MKLNIKLSGMRNFLIFWAGQSGSNLGTAMTSYTLILWSYDRLGTASSIAFLSAFTYLPSVLFSFLAGTLADRWDKKAMMIIGDCFAACATLSILILFSAGTLQVWHLYLINLLLSCMNAFQSSAANVIITMLTPKDHFAQANGLFSLSGSVKTILTPAIATALYVSFGLVPVLLIDLTTFFFAIATLAWKVNLPELSIRPREADRSFLQSCLDGIRYILRHKALLRLIMVFAFMNLVVNMGSMGLYSALILSRPAGGKSVLSMVTAAIGIGTLIGSLIVAGAKPAKRRTRTIFASCILSCLFYDFALSLGQNPWIWCSAAAIGNVFLPFINANLTATMRIKVPVSIQGRVISAQTTLQCFTIPVGLFLGGILADHVFEPFMQGTSGPAEILRGFLGTGKGSGIALLILIQAVISLLVCVFEYLNPSYRSLDNDEVLL